MFRSIIPLLVFSFINISAQVNIDSLMFSSANKFWADMEYVFVKGRLVGNYGKELEDHFNKWRQDEHYIVKYEDELDSTDLTKKLVFFGPIKSYKNLRRFCPKALIIIDNGFMLGNYKFTDAMNAINIYSSDNKLYFQVGNSLNAVKSLWTTMQISQYFIMQNSAITHHGFLKNNEFDPEHHYDVWALRNELMKKSSTGFYDFYYDPAVFTSNQNLDSLFRLEDQKLKNVVSFFRLKLPGRKIKCFLYKDLEQKYFLSATPGYGNPFIKAYENHSVGFAPVEHETIHILFNNQVGIYSTFFSEGTMGYYYATKDSTEWKRMRAVVSNLQDFSIKDYLENSNRFNFSEADYAGSGYFVKFLIDTYGLDKYKSFFSAGG